MWGEKQRKKMVVSIGRLLGGLSITSGSPSKNREKCEPDPGERKWKVVLRCN